jgi:hypothetical protein
MFSSAQLAGKVKIAQLNIKPTTTTTACEDDSFHFLLHLQTPGNAHTHKFRYLRENRYLNFLTVIDIFMVDAVFIIRQRNVEKQFHF